MSMLSLCLFIHGLPSRSYLFPRFFSPIVNVVDGSSGKNVVFMLDEISKSMFGLKLEVQEIRHQTAVHHRVFTPSSACKTENVGEFVRVFSSLNLAYSPSLTKVVEPWEMEGSDPKFEFRWTATQDSVLENTSYEPLCKYLRDDRGLFAFDVSEGGNCFNKNLYDSEVYTLRPTIDSHGEDLRKSGVPLVFIEQIRGRTDIVIVSARAADQHTLHKSHVLVAIEVKTVAGFSKDDACLREAATQLIGLNAENVETSPCVLLTNLYRKHYVLFLALEGDPHAKLVFKLHIKRCQSFEAALDLSLSLSERRPISVNFGRRPTPPSSEREALVDSESDS